MESPTYLLFEHSVGYALFRLVQFEEIGKNLPQVESAVLDLGKFSSVVKLVAFSPFQNAVHALENCNAISEGVLHPDLFNFLETNVPVEEKIKTSLGVSDSKISAAISETLPHIQCSHTGVVPEVIRGIRVHFPSLIKGLSALQCGKAQLGLGHSYSRSKVKFNVNRVDNMIIQSIALLDQLDKDINTFSMRIREWYSYHFPELYKLVPDQYMYCRATKLIRDRKTFNEETLPALAEIVLDEAKAQDILEAARSSMGMDITDLDLINIERFATRVASLAEYRRDLQAYLKEKMSQCAPSLSELIGEQVGARLISHAGSLTNLAKYPASTVQILGAEKALFRALKTKGNTPKYGLLFHSSFIGRASAKNKGRISRYLANKCSLASRIDCFAEFPVPTFGEHLRSQVEERLKFFETGDAPRKNAAVMHDAFEAAKDIQHKLMKKRKKQEKKESRAKAAAQEQAWAEAKGLPTTTNGVEVEEEQFANGEAEEEEQSAKKKKKKKRTSSETLALEESTTIIASLAEDADGEESTKKKQKKRKRRQDPDAAMEESELVEEVAEPSPKRKSKRTLVA